MYDSPSGLNNLWMSIILNRRHAGCSLRESLVKPESAGRKTLTWSPSTEQTLYHLNLWVTTYKQGKQDVLFFPCIGPSRYPIGGVKKIDSCHTQIKYTRWSVWNGCCFRCYSCDWIIFPPHGLWRALGEKSIYEMICPGGLLVQVTPDRWEQDVLRGMI